MSEKSCPPAGWITSISPELPDASLRSPVSNFRG